MIRTVVFLFLISGLLIGCQHSPSKRYYLLSTPPITNNSTMKITQSIGIGPIELPDYLQRTQMIFHKDSNTIEVEDIHYWAEPLDKGITRVLALQLTQRDGSRALLPFPWRSVNKPKYSLRLHIHELKLIDNQASINCTWELVDNTHKKLLQQQHFIRKQKAKNTPEGLASSYSEIFTQLADEMDILLRNYSLN